MPSVLTHPISKLKYYYFEFATYFVINIKEMDALKIIFSLKFKGVLNSVGQEYTSQPYYLLLGKVNH